MQNESTIDPKIIEEVLKFSRNVIEAPKFVSAPDEINLEVTPHKVVQQIDKTRQPGFQADPAQLQPPDGHGRDGDHC